MREERGRGGRREREERRGGEGGQEERRGGEGERREREGRRGDKRCDLMWKSHTKQTHSDRRFFGLLLCFSLGLSALFPGATVTVTLC